MKKIFITTALFTAMSFMFTGCLKDKGFANNEYGINDPDTQPPGVGFPLASKAKNDFGLNVSASPQTVTGMVYVNLESGKPAPSDINITLTNTTTAKVAAYNTANGLTGTNAVLELPSSIYTVAGSLVIPAGGRNVETPINVSNTTALDPNRKYGFAITISSVDGGYTIASNLQTLFIVFSIKNKYDGKYRLQGYHNRNSPDYTLPYDVSVYMITTGPNSVVMWYPTPGPNTYAHPINGNGGSYYGSFSPNFSFNPATDLGTTVVEYYSGATPMEYVAGSNSRYDAPTKKMYMLWRYNANDLRRFYDTLTYLGPRP